MKLKPGLGDGVESALGVVVEVVVLETAGEDIREGGWVALWGGVWRGEQGEFVLRVTYSSLVSTALTFKASASAVMPVVS